MPCLLPKYVDILKEKFNSGELNPQMLLDFPTSKARHEYFAKIVGEENAGWVNAAFESKVGLKWQENGITGWAEKLVGIAPESKRDMLSRVQRMEKILTPTEREKFLADLTEQRLGVGVSVSEAAEIVSLAREAADKRVIMETGQRRKRNEYANANELAYGLAYARFNNYLVNLKRASNKKTFKEWLRDTPVSDIGGLAKSLRGTGDDSSLLRQGWKTLLSQPKIWKNRAIQTFQVIWDTWGGGPVKDLSVANIVSHPDYNRAVMAKLDIGTVEEAYPITVPEELTFRSKKIPVVSKLYKIPERAYRGSENAFTIFLHNVRFDTFLKWMDIAEKAGVDTNNREQLEAIGRKVNSLGARGHLGKMERAAEPVNNLLFSARNFKSNVDVLLAPLKYGKSKILGVPPGDTEFALKQAAIESTKIIIANAALLALLGAVGKAFDVDDMFEIDPRSANWGKIRIKDTRFDMTGGAGSLIILAARIATMSSKSSITGKVTKLNTGNVFTRTGADVVNDFIQGKLSPSASVIRDLLEGITYSGDKLTFAGELINLFEPLPITNAKEAANNPNSAPLILVVIADNFGMGANTYSNIDWFKDEEEEAVSKKYNIPILSKDEFAKMLSYINKRGEGISDPGAATVGSGKTKRELEGDELRDYRIYRQLVIRRKLAKNRDRIKKMTNTALERFINNVNINATEESKGKFKKGL